MPRVCTVCTHSEREAIDRALVDGAASRYVAKQHGIGKDAVHRHKAEHLPEALAKGKEAADVAHGDTLLSDVRGLQARALAILDTAEDAGDLRTALGAIREARGNLELLAKLLGELKDGPTVNLVVAPQWLEIRAVILQALRAHPEAGQAVVAALASVEGHARN